MKKHVMFLAAATALALASCSNDHDVELNHGSEICFRTAFEMPHHGSRAAEYNNNTGVGDIVVTATCGTEVYFQDVEFTKTEGSNSYTSTRKYYWPGDDRELKFTATKVGQPAFIGKTFAPVADWANQEDLVYSFGATGKQSTSADGITLDFNHALSQIEIMAKNVNEEYVIKVVNAKIGHVGTSAAFDLNANAWGELTATESYSTTEYGAKELVPNAAAISVMGAGGNAMVMPQQLTAWNLKSFKGTDPKGSGSYIALMVSIKTKAGACVYPTKDKVDNGEAYAWVAVPINTLWEKGKKYTYTLVFGHGAGYTDPENPTPGPGPDPDPKDPYPVLDGEITVIVNAANWSTGETVTLPGTPAPAAAHRK